MKTHPFLQDPNTVLVMQIPVAKEPAWDDYRWAAFEAMQALQIELEGERAVIKPNVTSGEHFADPDTGITTHPGFVQGMVEYLQAHGARRNRVAIVEDPRNSDDNAPRHWKGTGFERVSQATGAQLRSPTTYTCIKKDVPHPLAHSRLNVSRLAVAEGTALFNVPKLKTHNLAITTLCMKNLMGLVNVFDRHYCAQAWQEMPDPARSDPRPRQEWLELEMHELWQAGLARRLIDTAQVIRPALNLVEGILGREGTGFQRGRNRLLGLIIAGANLVAVDSLASYLMGFDPQQIVYVRMAAEAGLGCAEISKLSIYTLQNGEFTLCPDPDSMRITPPFHVIKNILNDEPAPFKTVRPSGL